LTSEGFKVWCDKFELLGGESYPRDIDQAIKEKTFRVLALLSMSSVDKPNPRKERTLALNIARERGVSDFLIPLNIDGLRAAELDWMTSDITFIPFYMSWADGLSRLLKKLDSIDAPRDVENGKEIAANVYLSHMVVDDNPETLYSNCLRFTRIPEFVKEFRFIDSLSRNEMNILSARWAFYNRDYRVVYGFTAPPDSNLFKYREIARHNWIEMDEIDGIPTYNILINLLKRSLAVKMLEKMLRRSDVGGIYFPFGLFDDDKLNFTGYTGRKTWILVAGERHSPYDFKYHISPSFKIKKMNEDFLAELSINLYLTGMTGDTLDSRLTHTRHKAIRKSWWNNHYLNRCLAVCEYLSDGDGNIRIGEGEEGILLEGKLISFKFPLSIDESKLQGRPEDETEDEFDIVDDEDVIELENEGGG
jgi:hypothetical protein